MALKDYINKKYLEQDKKNQYIVDYSVTKMEPYELLTILKENLRHYFGIMRKKSFATAMSVLERLIKKNKKTNARNYINAIIKKMES